MTLVQLHEALQVDHGLGERSPLCLLWRQQASASPPASSLLVVAPKTDSMLTYVYDFDDRWTHRICTRSLFERRTPLMHLLCTVASRACPPEDSGGIARYQRLAKPPASERREKGVLPIGFTPSRFDKD